MKIFGLGMPELLIILGVALLIFGPKHLPKLGSALGKTIKGIRDGLSSDKSPVKEVFSEEEEAEAPKRKKKAPARLATAKEAETAAESEAATETATA